MRHLRRPPHLPQSINPLHIQLGHCAFPSVNHLDFLLEGSLPNRRPHLAPSPVLRGCPICPMAAGLMPTPARPAVMMDRCLSNSTCTPGSDVRCVFPNIRQQALANINSYLMQGKFMFLHPENPTYRYYLDCNPARVHPRFLPGRRCFDCQKKRRKTKHKCSGSPAKRRNANYLRLFSRGSPLGHPDMFCFTSPFQRAGHPRRPPPAATANQSGSGPENGPAANDLPGDTTIS